MERRKGGVGVVLDVDVRIPPDVRDLASFRAWARSDDFPERGRIDFIAGDLEIDVGGEDIGRHADPKGDLFVALQREVKGRDLGRAWVDGVRFSNDAADVSAQPDILVCLWETLRSGRAKLVAKATDAERWVEIEGTVDLIVEIVSDSSVAKDTRRLRDRYERAGVREYWIVDARGSDVSFTLLANGPEGFAEAVASRDGWRRSDVLAREVRITRTAAALGFHDHALELRRARKRAK